jgi:hypothetical protein
MELLMFYDGPEPPLGIFDGFLDLLLELPVIVNDASFLAFFNILPSSDPFAGSRSVLPPLNPRTRELNLA